MTLLVFERLSILAFSVCLVCAFAGTFVAAQRAATALRSSPSLSHIIYSDGEPCPL